MSDIQLYLIFASFLLVPLLLQILVLRLTRHRFRLLRWSILLAVAFSLVLAVLAYASGDWLWEVAVFLCLLVAILILAGWGLGWLVYSRWEKRQKRKSDENSTLS